MTWHHRVPSPFPGRRHRRSLKTTSFPGRRHRRSPLGICLVFFIGLGSTTVARAEMAEEVLQHATDSASTHLFTVNPAVLTPKGLQGGVLLLRQTRTSTLDHTDATPNPRDKIQSEVQTEHQEVALSADLGAGAGIGVSHEIAYHKVETDDVSANRATPLTETTKTQHSQVRLLVELTSDFEAGVAVRYLYKDVSIFGEPFMSAGNETKYRTTMVGYGSGAVYRFKSAALAYTYYPPLRGKTEVEGEEKIVVEPGQIGVDGFYEVKKDLKIGLAGKRWINEIDDLASGTTAEDDQTNISLYGLDPDQYLFKKQLVLLGMDWDFSKAASLRASLGQEVAELNFGDLMVYNRAGVNARGSGKDELKYNRARVMLRFSQNGMEADAGIGLCNRDHDLPSNWNGGSYKATEQELFATIGMKL